MTAPPTACQIALAILVVAAAVYDARQRRIPNWLTLPGLLAGLLLSTILDGLDGLRGAALGTALALAVYVPLYALRALGGGDVKLMAAVGALAGPSNWLAIFAITSVAGGAAALLLILARGRLGQTLGNIGFIFTRLATLRPPHENPELDVRSTAGLRLPHGVMIAFGTLMFLGVAARL